MIKILRVIPFITTILIMASIFMFSAQTSTESSKVSAGVTQKIVNILPSTKKLSPARKQFKIKTLNHYIRKMAHFSIYFVLGFSAAAMFLAVKSDRRIIFIWISAVVFSMIYACTDEIHQFFVAGRGPGVRDVMIDTAGAAAGSGLFSIITYLLRRQL